MPKGFFSQAAVVLFQEEIHLAEIRPLLTEFNVVQERGPRENWEFGGPSLAIEYLPEVNGYVTLDVVNHPWPDHMGDPKNESTLMGAWVMGHFGPFTFPGGLGRALQQSWRWEEAKVIVPRHKAFVRMKITYVFGAGKDTPILPEGYQPLPELEFLSSLASTVLQHPKALCYFNPNGEVVATKNTLDEATAFARNHDLPAFDTWINVRLFNLTDDWLMMDTVGNHQLDIPDIEVAFPKDTFVLPEVDRWMRNVSLYLVQKGRVIKDGDTMDGPGGQVRLQGKTFANGVSDPPREVIRWLPMGVAGIPLALLQERGAPEGDAPKPKRRKWLFW